MHRLVVLALALAVPPVLFAETDTQIRAAQVVGYGIFEPRMLERSTDNSSSAPGRDNVSGGIKFDEFTDDIPAKLGTNFGFQYIINSTPRGGEMLVTNVIKFPGDGLITPRGRVYKESTEETRIKIGRPMFYGYGFDFDWELVPGEWVFEVWYKEARLVRKKFNVLSPEEFEEVADES